MSLEKWKILLIDDEEDDYVLTRAMLDEAVEARFSLTWANTYEAGWQAITSQTYDAVLMDYDLGASTGLELARAVFAAGYHPPILLLSGRGSQEVDVEAIQAGLADYINKNRLNAVVLERAIRYAIERQRTVLQLQAAKEDLAARNLALEQANAALAVSEERFRLAVSAMKECVWDWDFVHERCWRSQSYQTVFGPYPGGVHAEIEWWREKIHPADRARVLESLRKAEADLSSHWECEYRFQRGDGSYAHVLDCAEVSISPDGRLIRATGVLQDLTRLRETENRYRQILETSYEGIWSMNAEGITDYINPRGAEILGCRPEDIVGKKPAAFLLTEDAELAPGLLEIALADTPGHSTYRVRRKDGDPVWISASHAPVRDEDGSCQGVLVVFTDISERKRTEQALLKSQQRFHVALASTPLVVFTTDHDLRYTWISHAPHGLRPQDLLGRRDQEIPQLSEVDALVAAKQQVINTGRRTIAEFSLRILGKPYYYVVNIEPVLDEEGQVTGLNAAALDLSEQRKMELEHRESMMRMEVQRRLSTQREKERQEIARNIHDGPLQGLIALIFRLQYQRPQHTDPQAGQAFDQAAAQMKAIVRELRNVVNELRPPVMIEYGLARAIRIHTEDLRSQSPKLDVHLDLFEDGQLLPEHTCLELYRIYQECLTNVIRHAEADQAEVVLYRKDDQVVLEVKDNGKGMASGIDWTDLVRSSHFGLAGIKERVDVISGTLNLISAPGQGTIVQVIVPIPAAARPAAQAEQRPTRPVGG